MIPRLVAARTSTNPSDFALVAMLGLLGLRVFEACNGDVDDLGEEHGHRVLRVLGKGTKLARIPLPPAVGRAIDLRATTAASEMTLGGLVKHVALVEADWLAVKLAGREYGAPWDAVDFDTDPSWDWRTGAQDTPEDVYAVWRDAVKRSRELVAEVVKERGLDGPASFTWPNGRTPTVRDMLLDMIEEYARHTGHADILREAVDGLVGEGAPEDFTF